MMLGKLQRVHPTLRGHFAPAYLVGSDMLGVYLFFIYDDYLTHNHESFPCDKIIAALSKSFFLGDFL